MSAFPIDLQAVAAGALLITELVAIITIVRYEVMMHRGRQDWRMIGGGNHGYATAPSSITRQYLPMGRNFLRVTTYGKNCRWAKIAGSFRRP